MWRARLLLAAFAFSVMGDGAAKVALLLRVHDSEVGSAGLAVVLGLFALPVVLLVGVAGALADRRDPRPVVLATGTLQILAAAVLAWRTDLVGTAAAVLVLQTGFALANSTWVVALPRIVGEEHVGALISVHHALIAAATPLGAGLGGLLVDHVGGRAPFVLNALTFAPLVLAGLLLPCRTDVNQTPPQPRGVLRTLMPIEGIRALQRHPLLAVLTWTVLPFVIALESVNAIEVFLVKDVLGGSSSQFGAAEAAAGIAAVLGALMAAAARTARARALAIVAALAVISVVQVGQGLAPNLVVFIPLAASVGLLLGVVNALIMTLMVTATDARSRGSVVAFVGGASRSCGILALAVGGALGTVVTPRAGFVIVGVVGLAIAVVASAVTWRRLHRPLPSTLPDGADCGHVSDDGDGHCPRQRSGGSVAPQRCSLPRQDRDHRRGDPAELP